MSLILDLPPETELRLQAEAARHGQKPAEFVLNIIERELPRAPTARELLAMPPEQRRPYLEAAAAAAAPVYEEDLARPPHERELTALTILDGEDFYNYDE
jgi:hypothetical protein